MRPWMRIAGWILVGLNLGAEVPGHLLRPLLGRLKGIPAALVEQRPQLVADRLRLVQVDWKRMGPEVLAGMPEEARERLRDRMDRLAGQKGLEAARTALEAQRLLAEQLPAGRERAVVRADRELLDAWLCVEEGRWQALPVLEPAFADVLREGDASRARLGGLVREHLKQFEAGARERDKAKAQMEVALLRRLLEELDAR